MHRPTNNPSVGDDDDDDDDDGHDNDDDDDIDDDHDDVGIGGGGGGGSKESRGTRKKGDPEVSLLGRTKLVKRDDMPTYGTRRRCFYAFRAATIGGEFD
ncbi:hypothetical protein M0804_010404 [Polistes exclamans]|nr:hypothetical protein M0804_010404 [Polistes exclamans]